MIDMADEAGLKFGTLVLTSQEWVHRRVERFVIESSGECTRHISLDFTVPAGQEITVSENRVLVPLGLLRKGPLAAFSVTGPQGSAVPVLETAANSIVSQSLLLALASNVLQLGVDHDSFVRLASAVVSGQSDIACSNAGELASLISSDAASAAQSEPLISLIKQFAEYFLLVVELDHAVVGRRTIIKYTYREPRGAHELRPMRPLFEFDLPEFGVASSTHFEFSPPPLLLVAEAHMLQEESDTTAPQEVASLDCPSSTCHLVARPAHRFVRARVTLELAPRRFGAISAMWTGALCLVLALVVIVAVRCARTLALLPMRPVGSGTAAVLLAAAGVLMTWTARAPEDWTTSQILSNARRSLMFSAALATTIALFLAVPVTEPYRTVIWFTFLGIAAINLAIAWWQRRRCQY